MKLYRCLAVVAGLLLTPTGAVKSLVDLGYSKYQGKELEAGVTQWLKIRYAAAPLGKLRFSPPQDPVRNDTIQDATGDYGLICLSTGGSSSRIGKTQSEDCLFANVWAPTDASPKDKLPVFIMIQGGGFNSNSGHDVNGTSLIVAGDMKIVMVTFNYRVGPYGFLNDDDQVTSNIGLLDQRKIMTWVQKHIAKFGGDPNHVTIGGDSAGAASIALQLTAYGGRDYKLFHAAAAESVAFANMLTRKESVYQFENFAMRLGCVGSGALACLRGKTAQELQDANFNIPFPNAPAAPLYMWGPVVDGDLVQDVTYRLFERGKFVKVPTITGDDTNGGTQFAPRNTTTLAQGDVFLKTQWPFLTLQHINRINELYPNQNTTCPAVGCYWRQVSDVFGQMRYMCPGIYVSGALTRYGVPSSWNYRYNVEDPAQMASGLGVPHTVEAHAIYGPGNGGGDAPASYYPGGINAPVVPVLQGYWSSFIRSYDPNKYRHRGTPEWERWTERRKQRILFNTGGETKMENIGRELEQRCSYFFSIGAQVRQ